MKLGDHSKLGQTTYQATSHVWRDDMPVTLADGEYKTVQAAKLVARSWLAKGATHFTIYRGTYGLDGLHNEEWGYVELADWQQDDRWVINGYAADGRIDWEEESW